MRLEASGEARVCCLHQGGFVTQDGVEVSADRQSLMEIWNADTMREMRRAMVEGRPIAGCEMCYTAEAAGGESIRQFDNANWERGWLGEPKATVDEMMTLAVENDFRLPKLPELIDLHATSLCNLKCRMCNSNNSSRIAKDAVHRSWEPGRTYPREDPIVPWLSSLENLVNELSAETGSEVRRISFAGGEPLLLRQTPTLLERLVAAGRAPFFPSVHHERIGRAAMAVAGSRFRRFDMVISVDWLCRRLRLHPLSRTLVETTHHFQLFKNIPGVFPMPLSPFRSTTCCALLIFSATSIRSRSISPVTCCTVRPIWQSLRCRRHPPRGGGPADAIRRDRLPSASAGAGQIVCRAN